MIEGPEIAVAVVDDHPIVLDGLESLLTAAPGIRVVGRFTDGRSAYDGILRLAPAVAIVNLRMPGLDGLGLVRRLRSVDNACRVILFTRSIDDQRAMEAIRLGVSGILLKELPTSLILECVRKVGRGERWLEQETTARVLDRVAGVKGTSAADGSVLTRRELQLVRLAAGGLRNSEIAKRLHIREGTVKIHLHNIYRKVGVRGRVQLALYARSRGLD